MIKIYIITTGTNLYTSSVSKIPLMWTACAITSQGKWLAGAVSSVDSDTALERCKLMASVKAKEMLSTKNYSIEIRKSIDDDVIEALKLAFANLP